MTRATDTHTCSHAGAHVHTQSHAGKHTHMHPTAQGGRKGNWGGGAAQHGRERKEISFNSQSNIYLSYV